MGIELKVERRKINRALVVSFFILASGTVNAEKVDFGYSFFSNYQYSDNVSQLADIQGVTPVDPPSGNGLEYGVRFDLKTEQTAVLAAAIDANLSRIKYSVNESGFDLDDDTRKSVQASLLLQPRSNNFRLSIIDSLQQIKADRSNVQGVNNTADVNTFSITPSYFYRLNTHSRIHIGYTYSDLKEDVEDTAQQNSSRTSTTTELSYQRQLTRFLNWSLVVNHVETEFKEPKVEFDQDAVFLRIIKTGTLTNYSIDLGRQRAIDANDKDAYQNLIGFSLGRKINRSSDLTMFYRKGFSEAVNINVSNTLVQLEANNQSAFVDGIAREERIEVKYDYIKENLGLHFGLYGQDIKSEDELQNIILDDERNLGYQLGFDYRFLGGRYAVRLNYLHEKTEFNLTDEENEVDAVTLKIDNNLSRKWTVSFSVGSRNAKGSQTLNEVEEKQAILGLEFFPKGR